MELFLHCQELYVKILVTSYSEQGAILDGQKLSKQS